jgi:tartrate dehydrogenase/decarboxylase/D-malate dehydrogenase
VAPGPIDLVVVRENSEGEYIRCGGRAKRGRPDEVAVQSAIHTRSGVERILRFGFDLARSRRKRLTMITKSNALVFGMVLWDDVFHDMSNEYSDVESNVQHADAAAMNFVRCPQQFDVVVASNLFGDLLTDLAGVIVGGLGLAASANINPERQYPSMFEPVHGSAPDIAGQGIANPIAAILSGAMMLDWLGMTDAAAIIRAGVEQALVARHWTRDLGGTLSTTDMTDQIISQLDAAAQDTR